MAYEIDYLPVGEGERAGDCIALRFWDPQIGISSQKVVVIDGGYTDSAELLIAHIKKYYGTSKIDLVIATHPDMDHVSGLRIILEQMQVTYLLMHKPWDHATDIKREFKSGKVTVSGIQNRLEEALAFASELEDIATKQGVKIFEPFQGMKWIGETMHVLGPSEDYYHDLLCHFKGTPDPKKPLSLLGMVENIATQAVQKVKDLMHMNHLHDEDSTSPENNSSAIILFQIDGHKLLFTGDAGKRAIEKAINYAHSQGIKLNDLKMFHVPHHGSKRNFGKTMMEHIHSEVACISAPKDSDKHPSKIVTNHLIKKGISPAATQGKHFYFFHGVTIREAWGPITAITFYEEIEL